MQAEFDRVPGDFPAFRWTLGVSRAALRLRRAAVNEVTRVPAVARYALAAVLLFPAPTTVALLLFQVKGALAATAETPNFEGLGAIVTGVFVLPAALGAVVGWFLLSLRWRRRAGIRPRRLTHWAVVTAEALTVSAILSLWVGSFTLMLLSGTDGMGTGAALLIATINTTMASMSWAMLLLAVEMSRRAVRRAEVRSAGHNPLV